VTRLDQNQLVADLARDIVAQTAPQELPLFRATSAAYFKNPDKVLKSRGGKDEILGFGAGEAVLMLTPSVLFIVNQVVTFVIAEVQKAVAEESSNLLDDLVKKMFKKFRPAHEQNAPPPLTPTQLANVHQLAYEEASRLALSDAQAKLLADSIVGSLAIGSP
jgi:hypothetical protein